LGNIVKILFHSSINVYDYQTICGRMLITKPKVNISKCKMYSVEGIMLMMPWYWWGQYSSSQGCVAMVTQTLGKSALRITTSN